MKALLSGSAVCPALTNELALGIKPHHAAVAVAVGHKKGAVTRHSNLHMHTRADTVQPAAASLPTTPQHTHHTHKPLACTDKPVQTYQLTQTILRISPSPLGTRPGSTPPACVGWQKRV